jgi:hypothetical protein
MKLTPIVLGIALALPITLFFGGCGLLDSDCDRSCRDYHLDDMEDILVVRSLPVMRDAWVPASPPEGLRWEDTRRIWWYVKDREVREEDIFPWAQSRPGESFIPVLEINFRGQKYTPDIEPPAHDGKDFEFDPGGQWSGLMRLVAKPWAWADYSDLKWLEVWLREKQEGLDGGDSVVMHVDLGAVSEDFYRPWRQGVLNTEDKDMDGVLSVEENTGYDGVPDGHPDDDPYDNYAFAEGDYSKINGTENNPRTVPDTEDLDGDAYLAIDNVHCRLSFGLSDTTYIVYENDPWHGGPWRLYRIPLGEAATIGGWPGWRFVRHARFFFTGPGIDGGSVLQIAVFRIVGISWLEEGVRTKADMCPAEPGPLETFTVSAKNTREHPDYLPPYDPGKDREGFGKREQSMTFTVKSLDTGHCGSACKSLPDIRDVTRYDALAFYVHGDERCLSEDLYLFVRVGEDSLNFYEYATKIAPGWMSIKASLKELANLKRLEPGTQVIYGREVSYRGSAKESGWMAAYGEPSFGHVAWIGAGVVNGGTSATSSSATEIWFDDFRLTDTGK